MNGDTPVFTMDAPITDPELAGMIAPADTTPFIAPPLSDGPSSSGGFGGLLDTVRNAGTNVLNLATTVENFNLARARNQAALDAQRAATDIATTRAQTAQQVALLQGRTATAAAAQGSIGDQLASGKYNTLMIVLSVVGLAFAYLQTVNK